MGCFPENNNDKNMPASAKDYAKPLRCENKEHILAI